MPEYSIRVYFHSFCDVTVKAKDEERAILIADNMVGTTEVEEKIKENLIQEGIEILEVK